MAVDYLDNVELHGIDRITKDRFYVYSLCHEDTPFYIGVGKDFRWRHHFYYAKNGNDCNTFKQRKINKIKRCGGTITVKILYSNISRAVSFSIEKKLIKLYKRRKDGGTLTNLTNGGEGGAGFDWSEEQRIKTGLASRGRNSPCSEDTVKRVKLLFHYRGYTVKQLAEMEEFKAEGVTEKVIRSWLNKNTQAFDYVLPHLCSPAELSAEKRQDCKKCFLKGFNIRETSDILGLPYDFVQRAGERYRRGEL